MASEVFIDISIIILIVVAVSAIMRLLKQPLIIGYIIAGILVSPFFFGILNNPESISPFAEIGIAILLFIVGLHLNPRAIKEVGASSIITGVGQVLFTAVIGFFLMKWLGFSTISAIYIAVVLTFSSTIIITKLLSDKGDIDSLYGRISIGFLIVQDVIAVVISIIISSFAPSGSISFLTATFLKGFSLIVLASLFGIYVLPFITKKIAKSQEFLLLFSLGWCFALAALFDSFNFSIEMGALLAGLTLAVSPYRYEISSRLKPLRDFFILMFFITLGAQMTFTNFSQYTVPIIVSSLFILIGNPLIVMGIMGALGYTSRTGFFSGLTVAQISELSFILIALGIKVGHLSADILSFVTVVGIITFATSTYLIIHSNKIYKSIAPALKFFERKGRRIDQSFCILKNKPYNIILFGYNRIGFSLLKAFPKLKKSYVVVDFNPETIRKLKERKINCIYGDADDIDFLEELKTNEAELIVSTIPDIGTNMLLLKKIRFKNKRTVIILTAHQIHDALEYYRNGADYVILPHFLGGRYTASLIENNGVSKLLYRKSRFEQVRSLYERIDEGHEHPKVEKGQ